MQKCLIVEEFNEWEFATEHEPQDHVMKELGDLCYVLYQYAANEGWNLDEIMDRIHYSNMSKLDKDGNPIFRSDGKILKGPNYRPPDLTDLV